MTSIKDLSIDDIKVTENQDVLMKVAKSGKEAQKVAVCLNENTSDDVLKVIAESKNGKLLELIVLNNRLTATDLFPYVDVSTAVAMKLNEYEDCTQEMLDYIDENHLIR